MQQNLYNKMVCVVTMNVNGLNDSVKRREVFTYCKKMKYNVILMQETHFVESSLNIIEAERGGHIVSSCGDSKSRGAAVLFNRTCNAEIQKCTTCDCGCCY